MRPALTRLLWRAVVLRCPECGISPLFPPLRRTRSFHDWVTPLHGCPHCDYAYEREPGYFLPATWIVHFFTVYGLGVAVGLLADWIWNLSAVVLVLSVGVPTLLFSLLFVRHSKSIYLAFDHFQDPHVKPDAEVRETMPEKQE